MVLVSRPVQPFDRAHPTCRALQASSPAALPFGWRYFGQRPGNLRDFIVSAPGRISFSRIVDAQEMLVVATTTEHQVLQGEVVVDNDLDQADSRFLAFVRYWSKPCRQWLG
jgi:hypothetical protein